MKNNEFYQKYANTPLEKRLCFLNEFEIITLYDINEELKKIDNKLLPDEIRREKLLSMAEKVL